MPGRGWHAQEGRGKAVGRMPAAATPLQGVPPGPHLPQEYESRPQASEP